VVDRAALGSVVIQETLVYALVLLAAHEAKSLAPQGARRGGVLRLALGVLVFVFFSIVTAVDVVDRAALGSVVIQETLVYALVLLAAHEAKSLAFQSAGVCVLGGGMVRRTGGSTKAGFGGCHGPK